MGRLFGTDGIRGVAGTELSCDLALSVGKATAVVLKKHSQGAPLVILGKDTRKSSDMLEMAVASGLCAMGADVIRVGFIPTPAVAFLVKLYKADAGIMISASHNSYEYNGIKIFGKAGYKLSDDEETEIEDIILEKKEYEAVTFDNIGKCRLDEEAHHEYARHLISTLGGFKSDLKVLVDCCNGSACTTAKEVFDGLGCNYALINSEPDGTNINNGCGSTHIENICQRVVDGKYDLAVAFDGDADRMLAVDNKGEIVNGDLIMAVISKHMSENGTLKNNTAVVTVMSNLGFTKFCEENNIAMEITDVGDRHVLENMLKNGHCFGGEDSGHMIFLDYMTTGDGQLSAIQLIKVLSEIDKPLNEAKKVMKKYPQTLVNVKVTNEIKKAYKDNPEIIGIINAETEVLGNRGRILVRPSGTEPLVRVMVEADTEETAENTANRIADKIKALVKQ